MKNNITKFGLLALIWLIYILPATAGPVDPPGEGDPPYIDPTPIDNWLLILVFAAMALGIYFILRFRRKAIV